MPLVTPRLPGTDPNDPFATGRAMWPGGVPTDSPLPTGDTTSGGGGILGTIGGVLGDIWGGLGNTTTQRLLDAGLLGALGMGAYGNMQVQSKEYDALSTLVGLLQKYANMTPEQAVSYIQKFQQPMSQALTNTLMNQVQAQMGERGLGGATGLIAEATAQAMAPYDLAQQQLASQNAFATLNLPLGVRIPEFPLQNLSGIIQLLSGNMQKPGVGVSGGGGGGTTRPSGGTYPGTPPTFPAPPGTTATVDPQTGGTIITPIMPNTQLDETLAQLPGVTVITGEDGSTQYLFPPGVDPNNIPGSMSQWDVIPPYATDNAYYGSGAPDAYGGGYNTTPSIWPTDVFGPSSPYWTDSQIPGYGTAGDIPPYDPYGNGGYDETGLIPLG